MDPFFFFKLCMKWKEQNVLTAWAVTTGFSTENITDWSVILISVINSRDHIASLNSPCLPHSPRIKSLKSGLSSCFFFCDPLSQMCQLRYLTSTEPSQKDPTELPQIDWVSFLLLYLLTVYQSIIINKYPNSFIKR